MIGRHIRTELIPGMATPTRVDTLDYALYYLIVHGFGGIIPMAEAIGKPIGDELHLCQCFRGLESLDG